MFSMTSVYLPLESRLALRVIAPQPTILSGTVRIAGDGPYQRRDFDWRVGVEGFDLTSIVRAFGSGTIWATVSLDASRPLPKMPWSLGVALTFNDASADKTDTVRIYGPPTPGGRGFAQVAVVFNAEQEDPLDALLRSSRSKPPFGTFRPRMAP